MIDHDRVLEWVREPAKAREVVRWLQALDPNDWTGAELDWMREQLRRQAGSRLGANEQALLVRLHRCAKGYTHYRQHTVRQWIEIIHARRGNMSAGQSEIVMGWHDKGLRLLRQRQMENLVAILISVGGVDEAA